MTSRIEKMWKGLRDKGQKALVPYVTAGDPNLATTKKLILTLEKSGADLIELGVPFSDPMADGPVIQKASERALKKGTSLSKILELVKEVRKKSDIPILLMGYYNPILSYGLEKYARDAAKAGVDATLVVDLPPEESRELDEELKKVGIALIYLLAPTSDVGRIRLVASQARGFVYFVSMTGITGAKLRSLKEIEEKVAEIRQHTSLPLAIGFGISEPSQAKKISKLGDGVVVGSALVKLIHQNASSPALFSKVGKFVGGLKKAISS